MKERSCARILDVIIIWNRRDQARYRMRGGSEWDLSKLKHASSMGW